MLGDKVTTIVCKDGTIIYVCIMADKYQTKRTFVLYVDKYETCTHCCLNYHHSSFYVGLALWHIKPCRSFNAKSFLYIYIKYT